MPISPARMAANLANAQRSTGPKTEAGKARSRANALKHGLTGAGIALPQEDQDAIAERFAAIQDELMPQTVLGTFLAHQIALATVRCQRAARHETALLTIRAREAELAFDQARIDEAKQIYRVLYQNPSQHYRTLTATPEGVDCVVGGFGKFIEDLLNPKFAWSPNHGTQLAMLFDVGMQDLIQALSQAILGNPALIQPKAMAHLTTDAERRAWARNQMVETLRDAIDDLTAHRATLDHAAIARERALATEHALFDATNEVSLARRYEAASALAIHRALRDFATVEAAATATSAEPAEAPAEPAAEATPAAEPKSPPANELEPELGSIGPATSVPVKPTRRPRRPAAVPPHVSLQETPNQPQTPAPDPGAVLPFTVGRA